MLSPAPVLVRISHTIDRRSIRVGCCRCSASFDPSNPTTYSVRNLQSSSHRTIIPIAQYTFAFTIPQCYDQPYTLHSEYCVYFIVQIQYNVVFVVVVLVDDDAVLSLSLCVCVCVPHLRPRVAGGVALAAAAAALRTNANRCACFSLPIFLTALRSSRYSTVSNCQSLSRWYWCNVTHTHTHTHTHTYIVVTWNANVPVAFEVKLYILINTQYRHEYCHPCLTHSHSHSHWLMAVP
jgi:hypothetical protein